METRVYDYIRSNTFSYPTLVFSLDNLSQNYNAFIDGLPGCNVHYAVKANPHRSILSRLVELGGKFDAASAGEIEACLSVGALPRHISFGNTVKRVQDIVYAHERGVDLFAVDSFEEIDKVSTYAPGSRVFVRLLVNSTEAEWPLSRKFGCDASMVPFLMVYAKQRSLRPVGISFHVGSQTRHPHMWIGILDSMSSVWKQCRALGFDLHLLNVGGGFPSYYGTPITNSLDYNRTLNQYIKERFDNVTYLMVEPGRGMVANLGSIAAEVLLVSKKSLDDETRWVYLNIGRFSGLAETEAEAIKYQLTVIGKENHPTSGCILAGPTCDSADVMYEKHKALLPVDLHAEDKVVINNTGAYTTTYSSVAFNGFPPLQVVEI